MKLAFSAITDSDEKTVKLFSSFRQAGYDGLQLKGSQYMPYLDDPGRFLDETGSDSGTASALIIGSSLDEDGIAFLKKGFAFGSKVGTELIVFCHCVPRNGLNADDIRAYAFVLSELGKEALDAGLKLSIHNHFDQPLMHRDDFEVFFDAIEEGTVGFTVDTAHLFKSGEQDIASIIRHFSGVIDNFHLKDISDGEFKVLGEGEIDFEPVFEAVKQIGYDGWISADEESGADIIQAMTKCYNFISSELPAS